MGPLEKMKKGKDIGRFHDGYTGGAGGGPSIHW